MLCVPLQERFSVEKKLHTLDRLAWSDMFETFLANK
jgi:2-oxoglutarate dehydrogenase complex dehydrogenase (E1) component-like enzyme